MRLNVFAIAWIGGIVAITAPSCASTLRAQSIRQIALRTANATLDADFVIVTSVRELADGRVIVTDGRDQTLYLVDFSTSQASILGRKGKGPGEWTRVGFIQALSGDSSIMDDAANRRWLLFKGAAVVGQVPPDNPALRATEGRLGDVDYLGHYLSTTYPPPRAGTTVFTRADSNSLVLVTRSTGHIDTVARIRVRPYRRELELDSLGHVKMMMPFSTEANAQGEVAKLFADGWLAVVRLEPLRIDWRSPSGAWTFGKPLPLKPQVVDAAERRAIEKRRQHAAADAKKIGFPPPVAVAYPTVIPVMALSQTLRASSDGRLLLRRSSTARDPRVRYLVIDRRGGVDGEVIIGVNEDIVGFGPRSIYITAKDEDDIQRLRRHAWP